MNRQRAKELLPIIQAFAEGKEIQIRRSIGGRWDDLTIEPMWNGVAEYRIKPEPREWFLNVISSECYVTEECAKKFSAGREIVRVREVIE